MADSEVLRAPHVLEYPYVRSVGPVIGAFLTGLRDGRILGATSHDADRGGHGHRAPHRVRPRHERRRGRARRSGPVRRGDHVVVGVEAAEGPAPRPPLRLGARAAGRGHHGHAPRRRRRLGPTPCRAACASRPAGAPRPSGWGACRTSSASCPRGARRDRLEHRHRRRSVGRGPRHHPGHPDAPRLPVHRRPVAVALSPGHRPGQVHRAALPGVPQGLRPAARFVPDRRRRHHRPRRARQHRDGHDLLRGERALPGPVDRDPLHLRPDPPRRRQHRLHGAHPGAARRPRCAWACGSRRCGSPRTSWGLTMASVKYFRPNGEPDADYETFKEYL